MHTLSPLLIISKFHHVIKSSSIKRALKTTSWPGWEVVIGVEVHAQIKTRQKLFSASSTSSDADAPNTHYNGFDAAWPGTLPSLNEKCVLLAVRTALACGSQVQPKSFFDRKHYFYADLPAGYQITQRYEPFARGGHIIIPSHSGPKSVGIEQIQLEQDTAKSTFKARSELTLIDLNRAGAPLMEIVSQPDMRSPEEAAAYVKTLQALIRAVGSSDANMEQGSFRCDVNVSINRPGEPFGTRCEVKNLNSVKFLQTAIKMEVDRHIALSEAGLPVPQETRGFDEQHMTTYRLRSKEDAPDYRYMPDPNFPPLVLPEEYLDRVRASLPELPDATRQRLAKNYGLVPQDIEVLMSVDAGKDVPYDGEKRRSAVAYFEAVAVGRNPKIVVNWIVNEVFAQLTLHKKSFANNPLSEAQLGELIDMVGCGAISSAAAKQVVRHILSAAVPISMPVTALVETMNLSHASEEEMRRSCEKAVEELPAESALVREGNERVMAKVVGRAMKKCGGRGDAVWIREYLRELLLTKI
ncbi:Glutamyl-tRNA amidotransferase B subunit [Hysterangium stoloniferum]|nr:Glutamyl-tRNA amidotransferase B subunit [Hysterangium stoloniferum]